MDAIVSAAHAAHATGRIALTFINQRGIDRPTDIAETFVRELGASLAATQEPATDVSVFELARLLDDLDRVTKWGTPDAVDVLQRARNVIPRLLAGLSAVQLK